jgi:hypothetical protein
MVRNIEEAMVNFFCGRMPNPEDAAEPDRERREQRDILPGARCIGYMYPGRKRETFVV